MPFLKSVISLLQFRKFDDGYWFLELILGNWDGLIRKLG